MDLTSKTRGKLGNRFLVGHIATRGLRDGFGSDVVVTAFQKDYHLHRLILVQLKFFEALFKGDWSEQGSHQVTLNFDDPFITRESFEVVVAYLYGIPLEEEKAEEEPDDDDETHMETRQQGQAQGNGSGSPATPSSSLSNISGSTIKAGVADSQRLSMRNACSVLACAAYFEVKDLCEQSTQYLIRVGISMRHVVSIADFCMLPSYYPWSDRIKAATNVYLARNLLDHPMRDCYAVLERLPTAWLVSMLSTAALWVPSEWDRYKLCRTAVFRRRVFLRCHRLHCKGPVVAKTMERTQVVEQEAEESRMKMQQSKVDEGAEKEHHMKQDEGIKEHDQEEQEHTRPKNEGEKGEVAKPLAALLDDQDGNNRSKDEMGGEPGLESDKVGDTLESKTNSNAKEAAEDKKESVGAEEVEVEEEEEEEEEEEDKEEEEEDKEEEEGMEALFKELFSKGICYMNMSYEQLYMILRDVDPLTGEPFAPSRVINDALWRRIEFQARIEATKRNDDSSMGIHVDKWPSSMPWCCQDQEPKEKGQPIYSPFRFSFEFENVDELQREPFKVLAKRFFYAGSEWAVTLTKADPHPRNPQALRIRVNVSRYSLFKAASADSPLRHFFWGQLSDSPAIQYLSSLQPSAESTSKQEQQNHSSHDTSNDRNIATTKKTNTGTNATTTRSNKADANVLHESESDGHHSKSQSWSLHRRFISETVSTSLSSCTEQPFSCSQLALEGLRELGDRDAKVSAGDVYVDSRTEVNVSFKLICPSVGLEHDMIVLESNNHPLASGKSLDCFTDKFYPHPECSTASQRCIGKGLVPSKNKTHPHTHTLAKPSLRLIAVLSLS